MNDSQVKAIVAKPYVSPEDLVYRILQAPHQLGDWLAAKKNNYVGTGNDCQDCVIANFVKDSLTDAGYPNSFIEITPWAVSICLDGYDETVRIKPDWFRLYIEAIDWHNPTEEAFYSVLEGIVRTRKVKQQHEFSGNLANNILKVTLAKM